MESKRILVTGGAGFIGSSLVESLLLHGHRVVVVDNLSRGDLGNLEPIADFSTPGGNFRLLIGDCRDNDILEQAFTEFDGFDSIHHLAAINGTKWFDEIPTEIIDMSIDSVRVMIDFARLCDSKLIFYSSPEAFGENPHQPLSNLSDSIFPSPEKHLRHSYGASKLVCEMLIQSACRVGLRSAIIRPFNAYGARLLGNEYGQVVSIFFSKIKEGKPVLVHGDGSQSRSFTYIEDLIEGIIAVENNETANGFAKSYNLGSKTETTILELANLCVEITGKSGEVEIENSGGYPGDSQSRSASFGVYEKEIMWSPETSLREGLSLIWEELNGD